MRMNVWIEAHDKPVGLHSANRIRDIGLLQQPPQDQGPVPAARREAPEPTVGNHSSTAAIMIPCFVGSPSV